MKLKDIIWTEEMMALLIGHYADMPVSELARRLNVTPYAVTSKIASLGLSRPKKRKRKTTTWTYDQLAYLRENYKGGLRKVAQKLNIPYSHVKYKAKQLELRVRTKWVFSPRSRGEYVWDVAMKESLRALYPVYDNEYVAEKLNVSVSAVKIRAERMGIRKDRKNHIKTKRCVTCGQLLPVSDFYFSHGVPNSSCKKCTLAYKKAHYVPRRQEGSFYDFRRGRAMMKRGNSISIAWSDEMVRKLRLMYPHTKNEEICVELDMKYSTMRRKARELGLEKDPRWLRDMWSEHAKMAHFVNTYIGNKGQIKKGQHLSPATEFKRKVQ